MTFNNNASMVLFIPKGISVYDVIAQDTRELEEIGGSFEAIADRMDHLIGRIETDYMADRSRIRSDVFRQHGYTGIDILDVPGEYDDVSTPLGRIFRDFDKRTRKPWLIPNTEIEVVHTIHTRGFQVCPFDECGRPLSSSDYIIRNAGTLRELWINQTTSHLAREHHLLEKGNNYGISAREFYQHFI